MVEEEVLVVAKDSVSDEEVAELDMLLEVLFEAMMEPRLDSPPLAEMISVLVPPVVFCMSRTKLRLVAIDCSRSASSPRVQPILF